MENWIRNHDSFYITKEDQKIYFSDDLNSFKYGKMFSFILLFKVGYFVIG